MSAFAPRANSNISIDAQGNVRLLPQEDYDTTVQLGKESEHFVSKISAFSANVDVLTQILATHADRIEQAKKLAIGEQSRVQSETEYRRREQARLQANLLEIKAQSHRLSEELASLQQVTQEQNQLKSKLTSQR